MKRDLARVPWHLSQLFLESLAILAHRLLEISYLLPTTYLSCVFQPPFSQAWPWNWFHFSAVKWRHGYHVQAWTSDVLAASSIFPLLLAGDSPSLWGSFCSFVSTANVALTNRGANRTFLVQTRF
ncbi:hypothetical protein HJG60_009937 [Phyllostomus discolor]|uniref:Uncharacterized protein n=1 Tax=Phyllostomus discolor TaxID=89673 RepID=A0A834BCP7_9CHIR|nr:hypothetical protein HJG60_009937 [Phyllostomus discolor]